MNSRIIQRGYIGKYLRLVHYKISIFCYHKHLVAGILEYFKRMGLVALSVTLLLLGENMAGLLEASNIPPGI
jgi:hypothetical protein